LEKLHNHNKFIDLDYVNTIMESNDREISKKNKASCLNSLSLYWDNEGTQAKPLVSIICQILD